MASQLKNLAPRHFIVKQGNQKPYEVVTPDVITAKTSAADLCAASNALHARRRGAAATYYAAPRIHDALLWRRAKREHESLNKNLTDAEKKLESEQATLRSRLSQIDAQRQVWHSQAAQYHARGDKRGGRQQPTWLVLLKASLWAVVALIPGLLLGLPVAITVALPVVAGIAAFLFYRHRRLHPSYRQFKSQENVRFAVSTERPRVELPPAQKLLAAPREDRQ